MIFKNIFKPKLFIQQLPDNIFFMRLYYLYILIGIITIIVGIFHPDFRGIIKATYVNANLPWPPELNMYNLVILRDVIFMIVILFLLFFIISYILSFIISKVLLLFKRQISTLKTWNILVYASIISSLIELIGIIIFIPATYSLMFQNRSADYFGIYSLFQSISLILVVLTVAVISPLVNWILVIWGIKISLIKIKANK